MAVATSVLALGLKQELARTMEGSRAEIAIESVGSEIREQNICGVHSHPRQQVAIRHTVRHLGPLASAVEVNAPALG